MPENKIVMSVVGDYGNPTGTGLSRITLEDVRNATELTSATAKTAAAALHVTLVEEEFTGTLLGDVSLVSKVPSFVDKPGTDTNIDRILVADFRTKNDSTVRRVSIPGIAPSSSQLELCDNGERLTADGKLQLATALSTFFGVSGDAAIIVLRGKVLQKS